MDVRFSSLLKTKSEVNVKTTQTNNKTHFTIIKSQFLRKLSLTFRNITYMAINFVIL